jgi:DNA-binding beta-propeller fold protein YncE
MDRFIGKWGSAGIGDGQFSSPFGITMDLFGNIFVSEETNHRVQKFDSNGTHLITWDKEDGANGEFQHPIGVVTDSSGKVFVVD